MMISFIRPVIAGTILLGVAKGMRREYANLPEGLKTQILEEDKGDFKTDEEYSVTVKKMKDQFLDGIISGKRAFRKSGVLSVHSEDRMREYLTSMVSELMPLGTTRLTYSGTGSARFENFARFLETPGMTKFLKGMSSFDFIDTIKTRSSITWVETIFESGVSPVFTSYDEEIIRYAKTVLEVFTKNGYHGNVLINNLIKFEKALIGSDFEEVLPMVERINAILIRRRLSHWDNHHAGKAFRKGYRFHRPDFVHARNGGPLEY